MNPCSSNPSMSLRDPWFDADLCVGRNGSAWTRLGPRLRGREALRPRTGVTRGHRAETGTQPPHLAAVVDLVLSHMEPRPVRVHGGRRAERPLQPGIITSGKALEREMACFAELVNVVLERFAAKKTTPLGAEGEGWLPGRLFHGRRPSLLNPHSAFRGQTPDEMYFGTGDAVPADLMSRAAAARRARVAANRSTTCETCSSLNAAA